jgi:hypothetical protein
MLQTISREHNTLSTVEKCRLNQELEKSAIAPLETNNTLERGKAFLELITRISVEKRAIAQSFVNQFDLYDYNDYRTSLDGKRRHSYWHSVRYLQESGETWQFIRQDNKDKRGYVYRFLSKSGNRAFFPAIPRDIRRAINKRYGVKVPLDGSFWEWLKDHPEIPIFITEGGGKALSGLSHGFVVIAVGGCGLIHSLDLLPYLKDRDIYIALDSDTKPSAVLAVNRSLGKHLKPLSKLAKSVKVVTWDSQNKGLDDLIANCGAGAFEEAIATAKSSDDWLWHREIEIADQRLQASKIKPDLELDTLPSVEELQALIDKHRDVFVVATKGIGKSELGGAIVRNADYALLPHPLESLARNNAARMSKGDRIVDYRTDCDQVKGQLITANGYVSHLAFCVEAAQVIKKDINAILEKGALVFNDELDLQLNSLATSSTHAQNGKRKLNETIYWDMQIRAKHTLSVSADLTNYEPELFERKTGRKPYVIRVKPTKKTYETTVFSNKFRLIQETEQSIKNGERLRIACSRKSDAKFLEYLFRDYGAIAIHRDNASDPKFDGLFDNPNQWFAKNKPQIFIDSPILRSGFSITDDFFDKVVCFFEADSISASTALQQSERYRVQVPRLIYAAKSNGQHRHCTAQDILKTRKGRAIATGTNEIEFIDENDSYFPYKAADNWSKAHFRADIIARLQDEVETVSFNDLEVSPDESKEYAAKLKEFRAWQQQKLYESRNLSQADYDSLKDRRDLLEPDLLAVDKYKLATWSDRTSDTVTLSRIERDKKGRKRKALERSLELFFPSLAIKADKSSKESQEKWGYGIAHQDVTHRSLIAQALEVTGCYEFLDHALNGGTWHNGSPIAVELADKLRSLRNFEETKINQFGKPVTTKIDKLAEAGINLTCGREASNTAYVNCLLEWLGWSRKPTHSTIDGKRVRVYSLCPDDSSQNLDDLTRRVNKLRREGVELTPANPFIEKLFKPVHTFSNSPIEKVCTEDPPDLHSSCKKHIPIDDHPPDPVDQDDWF